MPVRAGEQSKKFLLWGKQGANAECFTKGVRDERVQGGLAE